MLIMTALAVIFRNPLSWVMMSKCKPKQMMTVRNKMKVRRMIC